MKSPYELLGLHKQGLDKNGNPYKIDVIKAAYRKSALLVHPDLHRDDPNATEKFRLLSKAHTDLCDPEKRANIDKQLKENPELFEDEKHLFLLDDATDHDSHEPFVQPETLTLAIYQPKGTNLTELIVNADYSSEALVEQAKQKPKFAEVIFDVPSILVRLSPLQQIALFLFHYHVHKTASSSATTFIEKSDGIKRLQQKIKESEDYQSALTMFCVQPQNNTVASFYLENNCEYLCSFLHESEVYLLASKFSCIVHQLLLSKVDASVKLRPIEVQFIVEQHPNLKQKILDKLSCSMPKSDYLLITDYLEAHEAINQNHIEPYAYFEKNQEKLLRLKFEAEPFFKSNADIFSFTVLLLRNLGNSWENRLSSNEIEQLVINFLISVDYLTVRMGIDILWNDAKILNSSSQSRRDITRIEGYFNSEIIIALFKRFNEENFLKLLKTINLRLFSTCQSDVVNFILFSFGENKKPLFLRLLLTKDKNALACLKANPLLLEKISVVESYKNDLETIQNQNKKSFFEENKKQKIRVNGNSNNSSMPKKLPEKVEPVHATIFDNENFDNLETKQKETIATEDNKNISIEKKSNDPTDTISKSVSDKAVSIQSKQDQQEPKDQEMDEETFFKYYLSTEFCCESLNIQTDSIRITYQIIKDSLNVDWESLNYSNKHNFLEKLNFLFKKQAIDNALKQSVQDKLLDSKFSDHFLKMATDKFHSHEVCFFIFLFGHESMWGQYLTGALLKKFVGASLSSSYWIDIYDCYKYNDANYTLLGELSNKVKACKSYESLCQGLNDSDINDLLPKLLIAYPACSILIFLQMVNSTWFIDKCEAYQTLVSQLENIKTKNPDQITDEMLNTLVALIQKTGLDNETLVLVVTQLKEKQPLFLDAVLFLLQERSSISVEKNLSPSIEAQKGQFQDTIQFSFFSVAEYYIKRNAEKISGDTLNRLMERYGDSIKPAIEEAGLQVKYINQKQLEKVLNNINASSNFHAEVVTEEQQISELLNIFKIALDAPIEKLIQHTECEQLYARIAPLWKRTKNSILALLQNTYPKKYPHNLLLWALILVLQGNEQFKPRVLETFQTISASSNATYFDAICDGIYSAIITINLQVETLSVLGTVFYDRIVDRLIERQLVALTMDILTKNSQLLKAKVLESLDKQAVFPEQICLAVYAQFNEPKSQQTVQALYQILGDSITNCLIKRLVDLDLIPQQISVFAHETLLGNEQELDSRWGSERRNKILAKPEVQNLTIAPVRNMQKSNLLPKIVASNLRDNESRTQVTLKNSLAQAFANGVYSEALNPLLLDITWQHSRILSAHRLAALSCSFTCDQMVKILQVEYASLPDEDKINARLPLTFWRHRTLEKSLEQVFKNENIPLLSDISLKTDENLQLASKILQWIGEQERSFFYKVSKNQTLFSSMQTLGKIAHQMIVCETGNLQELATLKERAKAEVAKLPSHIDATSWNNPKQTDKNIHTVAVGYR